MELLMPDDNNSQWQDFISKIKQYSTDPVNAWNHVSLLSYFIYKYSTVNGMDFIFTTSKNGPYKSKEIKDALKIYNAFDKGRYKQLLPEEKSIYKEQLVTILKEYIDWAFDIKFRGREVNVTGLGIFNVANFMNEFLQYRKSRMSALPRRNQPLSNIFLAWVKENLPDIWKTQQLAVLEDLNALYNYIEDYDLKKTSIEARALKKAVELGIMPKQGRLELNKK